MFAHSFFFCFCRCCSGMWLIWNSHHFKIFSREFLRIISHFLLTFFFSFSLYWRCVIIECRKLKSANIEEAKEKNDWCVSNRRETDSANIYFCRIYSQKLLFIDCLWGIFFNWVVFLQSQKQMLAGNKCRLLHSRKRYNPFNRSLSLFRCCAFHSLHRKIESFQLGTTNFECNL